MKKKWIETRAKFRGKGMLSRKTNENWVVKAEH